MLTKSVCVLLIALMPTILGYIWIVKHVMIAHKTDNNYFNI